MPTPTEPAGSEAHPDTSPVKIAAPARSTPTLNIAASSRYSGGTDGRQAPHQHHASSAQNADCCAKAGARPMRPAPATKEPARTGFQKSRLAIVWKDCEERKIGQELAAPDVIFKGTALRAGLAIEGGRGKFRGIHHIWRADEADKQGSRAAWCVLAETFRKHYTEKLKKSSASADEGLEFAADLMGRCRAGPFAR